MIAPLSLHLTDVQSHPGRIEKARKRVAGHCQTPRLESPRNLLLSRKQERINKWLSEHG